MKTSIKAFLVGMCAMAGLAVWAPNASARANVNWSVSGGNPYPPAVIYTQPQPIYVQPAPVYVRAQPVYVRPAPVVTYRPYYVSSYPQQYYVEESYGRRHGHRRHHGHGHGHHRN